MLILELVINALTHAKLNGRGISRWDAEQVIANGPLVIENPSARVAGSVFVIGRQIAAFHRDRWRRTMNPMSNEPTSDELDAMLAASPDAGTRLPPRDDVKVALEVQLDSATLARLTRRAETEGRDVEDLVADALRSAAA